MIITTSFITRAPKTYMRCQSKLTIRASNHIKIISLKLSILTSIVRGHPLISGSSKINLRTPTGLQFRIYCHQIGRGLIGNAIIKLASNLVATLTNSSTKSLKVHRLSTTPNSAQQKNVKTSAFLTCVTTQKKVSEAVLADFTLYHSPICATIVPI
jgi:hypothetical protein